MRWLTGHPTSPGWYIASTTRDINTYRWWNGICWSEAAHAGDNIVHVVHVARKRCNAVVAQRIEWIRP